MRGTLIVESLRVGSTLLALDLTVHEIRRFATSGVPKYQPSVWTVLEFEAPDELADSLASTLATSLDEPGWYANFSTVTETFVIYPAGSSIIRDTTGAGVRRRKLTVGRWASLNHSSTGLSRS